MAEKRGRPRRFFNWIIILAAAALIAGIILGWRYCGRGGKGAGVGGGSGVGTGGGTSTGIGPGEQPGAGSKSGTAAGTGATPTACQLRLDQSGLTLDGKPTTTEKAVEACAKIGEADIHVAGSMPYGAVEDLEKALRARGVKVDLAD